MPSFVTFEESFYSGKNYFVFAVWNYDDIPSIWVDGIHDGIVNIYPPVDANIRSFAEFVAGIFDPQSNFASAVCDRLGVPADSFRGVSFVFNNTHLTVTKQNANTNKIYEDWQSQIKKQSGRRFSLFRH